VLDTGSKKFVRHLSNYKAINLKELKFAPVAHLGEVGKEKAKAFPHRTGKYTDNTFPGFQVLPGRRNAERSIWRSHVALSV